MTARMGIRTEGKSRFSGLATLAAALAAVLGAQLASLPRAGAQQEKAAIVAKTADNAATGALGRWDFGGTDMTFKAEKNEVWILDSFTSTSTIIYKFKVDNLAANPTQTVINLPAEFAQAPVLGIAEVPSGDFKGKNLILIDPSFGTADPPAPHLGIYDDDGNLAPGEVFVPLDAPDPNDPTVRLSSIDVNPARLEIAAYDMTHHAFYILNETFSVVLGPVPVLGAPTSLNDAWFFGAVNREGLRGAGEGIAYNGADSLLVASGFYNTWETHFVLEYDLKAGGAYSGRAVDLSAAGTSGLAPDLAFVGLDAGKAGVDDILFCHNFADDSIYAFTMTLGSHAHPAELTGCGVTTDPAAPVVGAYSVSWSLPPEAAVDSIRVLENGVEVATLAPTQTTFTSALPLLGKAFVEVVTEKGGLESGLRSVCQVRNALQPPIPGVQYDAAQITTLGNVLSGVAVTKTPASPEEFRAYVIGQNTNDIEVLDYQLNVLDAEKLVLDPRVVTPARSGNLSAMGVALWKLNGEDTLAVLDPDGPNDNNVPSAMIFGLLGPNRGKRVKDFNPIDLSALSPAPFLFDWDVGPDNNFVAGASISEGEFAIVRILVQGDQLVATQMAPVPQRLLTPFTAEPLTGAGVSVLPNGNLLVAGSDTFSKTYTEALLLTPFVDEGPGIAPAPPKFVGYAQGLPVSNEFFGFGPGIGPAAVFGLDTAYFPPPAEPPPAPDAVGVGVSYLPTGNIALLANPAAKLFLITQGLLLIHAENRCSHPDLKAEQLADAALEIAPGGKAGTEALGATFDREGKPADFFLYVLNQSATDAARLTLEVALDGAAIPEASEKITVPAGRYYRRGLLDRAEARLRVQATNDGAAPAQVRIITGVLGIGKGVPPANSFRRGDCDGNGALNITDAIFGLNWLFKGGPEPGCTDAADSDDDGKATVTDMVVLVNHLFKSGPAPAAPGPVDCGPDPSADELKACAYTCE